MSSDGGEVGLFTAYTYLLTYLAVFFSNTAKLLNYFSFANVHCLLFCQHCYLVRPGSASLSVSPPVTRMTHVADIVTEFTQ